MKKNDCLSVEPLTVNIRTAAKMLGICERTIRNLTKSGELPVIRIASRVLYRREDLIEFVQKRSQRDVSGNDNQTDSASNPETT